LVTSPSFGEGKTTALVVHAKQEPSVVGGDVCLELKDAFEVEQLAKTRAVCARDERPVDVA
jgi:hypothetical protein